MLSMTGCGTGTAALGTGAIRLVVSLRSVNHRFLEVRTRLPDELHDVQNAFEAFISKEADRGRIDAQAKLEGFSPAPSLDVIAAERAFRDLLAFRDRVAPGESVPLASLLTMPGLFRAPALPFSESEISDAIAGATTTALAELRAMRRREGHCLHEALLGHLQTLHTHVQGLSVRAEGLDVAHRERLKRRLTVLLQETPERLDSRIETEIAILADRSDIAEELQRLGAHIEHFREICADRDPRKGRRLDFLTQELTREINTIGSKVNDSEVACVIVAAKAEIERIREQVQNVL